MELDDVKEEHSNLTPGFEALFADIIPPHDIDEDKIVQEAKERDTKTQPQNHQYRIVQKKCTKM